MVALAASLLFVTMMPATASAVVPDVSGHVADARDEAFETFDETKGEDWVGVGCRYDPLLGLDCLYYYPTELGGNRDDAFNWEVACLTGGGLDSVCERPAAGLDCESNDCVLALWDREDHVGYEGSLVEELVDRLNDGTPDEVPFRADCLEVFLSSDSDYGKCVLLAAEIVYDCRGEDCDLGIESET